VAPIPRKAVPSLTSDYERRESAENCTGPVNILCTVPPANHVMDSNQSEAIHEIGKMQGEDSEPPASPRGISRRDWFKAAARSSVGLAVGGFLDVPTVRAATQEWKLSEIEEFTTSCNFCSCGCGMVASVREGKLITMEGDYDHIVNRGSLCVKGISMFATHASPNRLATPRYRAPGSDRWEEISWENAVERIAQKIRKTRDATWNATEKLGDAEVPVNRTDAFAFMGGAQNTNEECYLFQKAARLLGTAFVEHQARL
jgi:formate dehydrogenase major subunit